MKKWYHSRTLWVNVIGMAVVVCSAILSREDIANQIVAAEASILAAINFILRLTTSQGLKK